ncbi:MAG: hypothetical protein ACNA8W_19015, partial [Bradymonadaceae bacterium]
MTRSSSILLILTIAISIVFTFGQDANAQEIIVRNDNMDDQFTGTIATAELHAGEMYAATFQIPDHLLPAELLGVRVIMVDSSDQSKTYCG